MGKDTNNDDLQSPAVESRADLAAQYAAFEESLTIRQAISIYWKSTLWIIYGLTLVFGCAMDGIIAANLLAIPKFREDYGEKYLSNTETAYIIPATWLAIFSGASQLCAIIGAFGAGWVADLIGRKYTTLVSCVISIIGVTVQYESNGSLGILAVGKAINGFPIGVWPLLGPLYASEVATLKLRGILVSVTNFAMLSSVLIFSCVTLSLGSTPSASSYRIPIACQWIVPSLVLLTIPMWPESPVWLVGTGRRAAAIRSIRRLYGANKKVNEEALLAQIEQRVAQEKTKNQGTYRECFSATERKQTMACMFVYACQYLSGIVLIGGYQSYLFELLGYSTHDSLLLGTLNIAVQGGAGICSWFLIPVVEHRNLILWGQLAAAVCLFIVGGGSTSTTQSGHHLTVAFIFIWVSGKFFILSSFLY
ncbi:hypothetical protein O1611_g2886 [Lasiodiplodia mahajangana]|uniref:Uncharacterized protein n=1 Tax=Lasiodiplodia mahajangana TaxID=1108764 RepID=A0ACC2JTA6_9PEZI|nr:hypothetical protein O1611_g2886 [Lasiodiplodia mahajangana]